MANYGSRETKSHSGRSAQDRPRDAQGRFVSTSGGAKSRGSMGETTGRSSTTSRNMGSTSFGTGAYTGRSSTSYERGKGSSSY